MNWDAELAQLITSLTVNAITRSAGPMARAAGIVKPGRAPEWLMAPITKSATENVLSMLAALSEANISQLSITQAAQALHSVEAENLQRTLVIEALAQKSQDPGTLRAQLAATLIYVGSCNREDAQVISIHLERIFIESTLKARDALQAASRQYYSIARQLALQEISAGYLEDISRAAYRTVARPSAKELSAIDEFVVAYSAEMKARTAELIPQHFDMQTRVPIDELYVAPIFAAEADDAQRAAPMSKDVDFAAERVSFSFQHAMRRMYRTVVLGAPGAGKTTLTQKLMHDLCTEPQAPTVCVPFLITLRKYQQAKDESPVSFVEYLTNYIESGLQINVPNGAVAYLLNAGRAVAIFDGLDELLHVEQRRDIVAAVESFGRRYTNSSVVVTSRIRGYKEARLNGRAFIHMSIEDLDVESVEVYARNWYAANPRLGRRERELTVSAFMRDSESASDLRSNPLLLSLMCNIYKGAGYIPQNRSDLYERCAMMLFDEWDQSRGIDSGGPLRGDAHFALQDIAHWVITERKLATGIPEGRLKFRLTRYLKESRYGNEADAMDAAKELLRLWHGRAWILTDIGSDVLHSIYHFTHRTFLEYFAGTYLARSSDSASELWEVLKPRIISGEWDVVGQIALQAYGTYRVGAIDKIYNLIIDEMDDLKLGAIESLVFACRNLDALRPGPDVLHRLVSCALRLVLYTLPCIGEQPDWNNYQDRRDDGVPEAELPLHARKRYEVNPNGWPDTLGKVVFSARHLDEPLALIFKSSRLFHKIAVRNLLQYITELISDNDEEMASRGVLLRLCVSEFLSSPLMETDELKGDTSETGESIDSMLMELSPKGWADNQLERLAHVNFWLPIEAARKGIWTIHHSLRTAGISCLFNSDSAFDLEAGQLRQSFAEDFLIRYVAGLATPADRAVCAEVGALARRLFRSGHLSRLVDSNWFDGSNVGEAVVAPYFLNTPADFASSLNYQGTPESDEDVLLGAGLMTCIFAEAEDWQLADLSEDQIAAFRLGPAQILETFFIQRYAQDPVHQPLTGDLDDEIRAIFNSWAERECHLHYRSRQVVFRNFLNENE